VDQRELKERAKVNAVVDVAEPAASERHLRVLRQVVLPLLGAPQVNAEQRERRPLARHLDFVGQVLRPTHTEREGGRLGDVVALAPGRGAARGQAELDL